MWLIKRKLGSAIAFVEAKKLITCLVSYPFKCIGSLFESRILIDWNETKNHDLKVLDAYSRVSKYTVRDRF